MAYIIDWKTTLLQTYLGLSLKDKTAAEGILGNVPFDKPRGNEFAPGLYHICYPGISYPNFGGIDFPCLIHNGDPNRDTILIVGEAPRRNKYAINPAKPCSLGSPYGIIFKEYPDQCWVYKQVFESLLDKGFNLYLTDVIKVWTDSKQKNKKGLLPDEQDYTILKEELDKIELVKIVTFGRKSKDMIRKIGKGYTLPNNIYHLYHPSQRNYDLWLGRGGAKSVDDIPQVIVDAILNNVSKNMFK